jgi:hypothetical protein
MLGYMLPEINELIGHLLKVFHSDLPLWKRGIKGDFLIITSTNPPSPPFAKGGKYIYE